MSGHPGEPGLDAAGARLARPLEPSHRAFGKDRRLRSRPDFDRVQRDAARAVSAHFVVLAALRNPPAGPSRIGLVVSRKVGNSVARSRVKRLCREAFRHGALGASGLAEGLDFVVIARSGADALSFAQVSAEFTQAARKLARSAALALAQERERAHDGRS